MKLFTFASFVTIFPIIMLHLKQEMVLIV